VIYEFSLNFPLKLFNNNPSFSFKQAQNLVATLLGAGQLALFLIYPSKPVKKVKDTKKKN
jgi:hypothetical protein